MLKRLRIKFVCILMVIVTVTICIILAMVLHTTRTNLERESLRTMQSIAAAPEELALFGEPGSDGSSVRLPYFLLLIRNERITVIGGDYFDLSDELLVRDILNAVLKEKGETGILEDYSLRYYRTTTALGAGFVFADASGELATMKSLWRTCLLLGGISFLVFLVLSFFLARWAVRPVEQAWNQQRQFVSDASHELKTPLTVILTNAELLRSPDYGEEERAQFAGNILTMSHQMRGLVESLLELARVDNGTGSVQMELLDLSKLISDALLPFEPVFFEKGLPLSSEIEPGIAVRGSEKHLRQLVEILLDNAQKYAAPGGQTELTLKRQGYAHCRLTVADQGEPIPQAEWKSIFKRFYRADKARTMNQSYGLGLSIAESAASLHHGRIWAESRDGWNLFHVELPLRSGVDSAPPSVNNTKKEETERFS